MPGYSKRSFMLICQKCLKVAGKPYKQRIPICGRCREVKKADLSVEVSCLDEVYLTERNRNRTGRPKVLTQAEENTVRNLYKKGMNIRKLADRYNVSTGKIHKVIHSNN